MRYQVLATDYDGTLATNGRVGDSTVAALERLLATGRKLVMVTGRELPQLIDIFPRLDLFEWVVAENGALLYRPSTKEEKPIAPAPSPEFAAELVRRGVGPISIGRVIVATWEPHENTVLDVIRDQGLELQVIFNKGAVMILPAGVNKAFGLKAALKEMQFSPHNVVGVGDAENDHALLRYCEFSAAVSNALPAVKDTADFTTKLDHGPGVEQLIDAMIATDLAEYEPKMKRHRLPLGTLADGSEFTMSPFGSTILVAGPSASGKSTFSRSYVEVLAEKRYQFCIIDPEGDYEGFPNAVSLGGHDRQVHADEVEQMLLKDENVVVTLTGMAISDRPPFFLELIPRLMQLRARTGRPHWLVLDEAHHLLPADWKPPDGLLPEQLHSTMLITVHPDLLAKALLNRVTAVVATGQIAADTLAQVAAASDMPPPETPPQLDDGEVVVWQREPSLVQQMKVRPCQSDRKRHRRKYAEGQLPEERSFYFTGPEGKLKLRAQNLFMFLQLAEGLDDETWMHHLRRGDYAQWFKNCVKDENLSAEAVRIERLSQISPKESRALIRTAIERDYTLPASPLPVAGAS